MKLTLTGLASQYIHLPLAPFCLKKAVADALPEVETIICDVNVNDTDEGLLRRMLAGAPDVIGISLYIWNRQAAARLIRRIKAVRPEITVIVGGPEATFDVAGVMTDTGCDFVLRGAGEESLPLLLKAIIGRDHAALDAVPGLCRWADGQLRIGDIAPSPAPRDDLYDADWQTLLNGRMVYAETSRGCPFSCAFCLSGKRERVVFMPKEDALRLLIRLGQTGTDTVKLIDRTFNCDRERTLFLLRGLIHAKADGLIGSVCYHMEVAADLFDEETLDVLNAAPVGLFQMEAGLQSFNSDTLDACDRHTDMPRLIHNLTRILAPGNVHLHIDLIAGLPAEDFISFGQSFDQAWALHPHQLQLGFLKLIHGSQLRARSWGQRFAPDPPYEVLSTPLMTYAELTRLTDCAEAVERIGNSGRFTDTMALILEHTGMRPFALFLRLGDAMGARIGRWSLDALTEMVLTVGLSLGVPRPMLRDAMVIDRLCTDNTGYLPPCLAADEADLRRAVRAFREAKPDVKRPRCALSSDKAVLYVAVWAAKHPVTQRGEVMKVAAACSFFDGR